MIRLTTYVEARDAYRQRGLRQALYDEGRALMDGVIVNLHGDAHLARRRLENRLFRRDTFEYYESAIIPEIITGVLSTPRAAGRGELLVLSRRTMLTLSLEVAGIDRHEIPGTPAGDAELDELYALMDDLARASTVAHASGDKAAIIDAGAVALAEFTERFYAPSRTRRAEAVAAVAAGDADESVLGRDVLTTLLRNQDRLDLPEDVVRREIAYFPWVGSHSTSNQLVHAMHHLFEWIAQHPHDRDALIGDEVLRRRFVHESMRLHPASPVSLRHVDDEVQLRSGRILPAGELLAIDLEAANRDPAVFGDDADRFDPFRTIGDEVAPWGLSFGHGVHACLGQELAGGIADVPDAGDDIINLLGSVTVMAGVLLSAGARPDPDDPATLDTSTTRHVFGRYPVLFDPIE